MLTLSDLWVIVAVGLPVVALLLPPLSTIDLTYQIRAGDIMVESHSILRVDTFSFTAAGAPWVNQQWGAELLFAAIYRAGGWPALILTRALLGGAIALLIYLSCQVRMGSRKAAAGLTIGGMALSFPGFILRPQILGLALFALTIWILVNRSSRPRWIWALPAVVVLWANLHGSFFLGPLLAALAYVEDRLERRPTGNRTLLVGAAMVLAATLNPFGLRIWSYVIGIAGNREITDTIVEWRPLTVRTPLGALFFASVLAVILLLARRGGSIPWPSMLMLATFFVLGLFATRAVYWWGLAAPPTLAALLHVSDREHEEPRLMLNTAVAALLLFLGLALLPWWRGGARDTTSRLLTDAPPGVTSAAIRVLEPGDRMFNPQIWGSWFEFALPSHSVFVDSRIEVIPARVWRDYEVVSGGQDGWQEVLDRWGIEVVVADRRQQAGLIPLIGAERGWRLVARDPDGYVFVRDRTPNPGGSAR